VNDKNIGKCLVIGTWAVLPYLISKVKCQSGQMFHIKRVTKTIPFSLQQQASD
jgi:hypothetical protein